MAAHPQLTKEEASKMVDYILSLADQPVGSTETPLSGSFTLDRHLGRGEEGAYYLTVQYTDKGARGMPALSDRKMVVLKHPRLQAEAYVKAVGAARYRPNGGAFAYVGDIEHHSSLMFEETDLTAIAALTFKVKNFAGGTVELHLNSADGPRVARTEVPAATGASAFQEIKTSVLATEGKHDLYFVFKNEEQAGRRLMELDWIYFHSKEEIVQ
jgi:cytochrome c